MIEFENQWIHKWENYTHSRVLARLYLKTMNQILQKLKYLDNETKVELKQLSTIVKILIKQIIIKTNNQLWQEIKMLLQEQ